MDIEQVLTNREIKVYTKEYFIYLMYKAIKGEIKELRFNDEYSFMDLQSDNPSEMVAVIHLFNAIKSIRTHRIFIISHYMMISCPVWIITRRNTQNVIRNSLII